MRRAKVDDSWAVLEVIGERCTQCGLCVQACTAGSLILRNKQPVVTHPEECDGCGTCEDACPEGAIECAFEIVWDDALTEADGNTANPTDTSAQGGQNG
jgi:ferredoxin